MDWNLLGTLSIWVLLILLLLAMIVGSAGKTSWRLPGMKVGGKPTNNEDAQPPEKARAENAFKD